MKKSNHNSRTPIISIEEAIEANGYKLVNTSYTYSFSNLTKHIFKSYEKEGSNTKILIEEIQK